MTLMKLRRIALISGAASTMLSLSAANGQVVQLPSTRVFSYSGSVLVPDGGSALLGSNSSAALVRGGRAISTRSLRAHATIIDLDAMDRAILGYDPREGGPPKPATTLSAVTKAQRAARRPPPGKPTAPSIGSATNHALQSAIDEAKSLVRAARGNVESAPETSKATYRLAIEVFDRLAMVPLSLGKRLHATDAANLQRDEASFLAKAARREFFHYFPAERLAPLTGPLAVRSRGAAITAMHSDSP